MIRVNLVGNPNTGKTTLFNCLTGAHEHVGNWHGVTVEEKAKLYKYKDKNIEIVDLPGIYSLTSLSYEEEVGVRYLLEHRDRIVLNICDASNLQRNLYLTLGLMELGLQVVLAVNQIEKKPICKIDYQKLSKKLGIPVVQINPENKDGIDKLNELLISYKQTQHKAPKYISELGLDEIKSWLNKKDLNKNLTLQNLPLDFVALKILENDERLVKLLGLELDNNIISLQKGGIEKLAKCRYDFIDEIMADCSTKRERVYGQSKLDKILLNRFLAIPIFVAIVALTFYLTFFSVGAWISDGFVWLMDKCLGQPLIKLFESAFPSSWVSSLIENAVVGGVGSILGFLPQVALLFLFLSILEDSGYLSRVAFVFDDILSKVGLSGKSVYTLLMGFGCSTTAVLTARNMEDKNSKIKTALLTPYMSCSAKFPIYAVLGGAFFGAKNVWVILGLYFLGVVVAVMLSFILEKTVLKSKGQTFILEFPPYHSLSGKRILYVLWSNVKSFLTRVGTLIISMNVIVWVLSNFSFSFKYLPNGEGQSMLESLGRVLSPIFAPLGFGSWGLVSALFAGLVAKEVIVSSIAMFGKVDESLIAGCLSDPSSAVYFSSPAGVLAYLAFCLLYFPCLATTAVLGKEIGKKWTAIGIVIELLLAYIVSLSVYWLARLFEVWGWWKVLLLLGVILLIVVSISVVIGRIKGKNKCEYCPNCDKSCK